ncbi:3,4-dihydroxy-2-butanone-4-phosphate synthase [Kushneria aurantia]|uniref:3,4-dihydroxy-2-butanone 4-phosphate synthase n=1 Tax=Kushneria aurantia TaxID=504092 RepID=A0ABV6G773_9GAMM|nr:3,4-dihydroxy-2-butanone-4-phosphate synthase [Kushneria aurantia]
MSQHQNFSFESAEQRVRAALDSLARGEGVVVTDDPERENEGDLIFAAATLTERQMAQMIRHGSGIVCLCLTGEQADRLELPPMVRRNESRYSTGFTVSIEAREGVTTGVSAHDRTVTVRTAVADGAQPQDLARPGHIFPLRARAGGVLARRGHTEATIDLVRLSGHGRAGVLCELMNDDGTMMGGEALADYAEDHGYPLVSIAELAAWREAHDSPGDFNAASMVMP